MFLEQNLLFIEMFMLSKWETFKIVVANKTVVRLFSSVYLLVITSPYKSSFSPITYDNIFLEIGLES